MKIDNVRRPWQSQVNQGKTYTDTSFYRSSAWRSLRALKLKQDPKCCVCGRLGEMVDHKIPITLGGAALDINNLQTMCNHDHNVKRAKEKNEKYKNNGKQQG